MVIIPIYKEQQQLDAISERADIIADKLRGKGITVKYDDRDTHKPGWKFNEYEFKGYPIRIAIGPRDMEEGTIEIARRDTLEKNSMDWERGVDEIPGILEDMQGNLYNRALKHREANTHEIETYDEFKKVLEEKGGFLIAHWDGTTETELKIKEETKATIRCIPLESEGKEGRCIYSGNPSKQKVVFAKAY